MHNVRIAVACDDPDLVVSKIGELLRLTFQSRESAYWGDYWTNPDRSIRIFFNEDPTHRLGQDSSNEIYFESKFPTHRTLVDVYGDDTLTSQLVSILESHFKDTQIVSA